MNVGRKQSAIEQGEGAAIPIVHFSTADKRILPDLTSIVYDVTKVGEMMKK
jgi:hypothetical protein